jgi:hypothetical protein
MPASKENTRRTGRLKAVLPIRMRGTNTAGQTFDDLVHTLDVTMTGIRVGAVRQELNLLEPLTIFFRKRRLEFRVVWTKKLKGTNEYQIGLRAASEEHEAWGLRVSDFIVNPVVGNSTAAAAQTPGTV